MPLNIFAFEAYGAAIGKEQLVVTEGQVNLFAVGAEKRAVLPRFKTLMLLV